jgi:hypothetical protein
MIPQNCYDRIVILLQCPLMVMREPLHEALMLCRRHIKKGVLNFIVTLLQLENDIGCCRAPCFVNIFLMFFFLCLCNFSTSHRFEVCDKSLYTFWTNQEPSRHFGKTILPRRFNEWVACKPKYLPDILAALSKLWLRQFIISYPNISKTIFVRCSDVWDSICAKKSSVSSSGFTYLKISVSYPRDKFEVEPTITEKFICKVFTELISHDNMELFVNLVR